MSRRSPQKLMPFPASQEFIDELQAGLEMTCYCNRSQFIRDAIVEKLHRMGVRFPAELAAPPPRGIAALLLAKAVRSGWNGKSRKSPSVPNKGMPLAKTAKPARRPRSP